MKIRKRINKIISLILAVFMILQPSQVFADVLKENNIINEEEELIDSKTKAFNATLTQLQGTGTLNDPYIIMSKDDFRNIENNMEAHYKLGADIDFETISWYPIIKKDSNNKIIAFSGSLDGAGYQMKNIYIEEYSSYSIGLFESVEGATFTNLQIDNAHVNPKGSSNYENAGVISGDGNNVTITNSKLTNINVISNNNAGGLLGEAGRVNIENTSVEGKVSSSRATGGFVGYDKSGWESTFKKSSFIGEIHSDNVASGISAGLYSDVLVEECVIDAKIFPQEDVIYKSSGLLGITDGTLIIKNNSVNLEVNLKDSDRKHTVGGLVFQVSTDEAHIENNLISINVEKKDSTELVVVGVSNNLKGTIKNNYFISNITKSSSMAEQENKIFRRTQEELKTKSNYIDWNFSEVWDIEDGNSYPYLRWFEKSIQFPEIPTEPKPPRPNLDGDGTEENPYIIRTAEHFLEIKNENTAYYILGNDIDLKSKPWDILISLEGHLDGKNFTVKNLFVDNRGKNSAKQILGGSLFSSIANGTVKNLKIDNVEMSGKSFLGALASSATNSVIENCSVTNLTMTILEPNDMFEQIWSIGGLVGYAQRVDISNCSVEGDFLEDNIDFYTHAQINGLGGLVGLDNSYGQTEKSIYSNCSFTGNITSAGGEVAGLVGRVYGLVKIKDCYVNANLNSKYSFIPAITEFSTFTGKKLEIENTYFTGTMTYNKNYWLRGSPLVGGSDASESYNDELLEIKNSYFNSDSTGITTPIEHAKTADEMMKQSTFKGWEFGSTWEIDEGNSYPTLKGLDDTTNNGNGNEETYPDINDLLIDTDGDGLSDYEEQVYGTDINNPDTDGDGVSDYDEIIAGTDPTINDMSLDYDGDGLINSEELLHKTNINNPDTDGDGLSDYDEIYIYNTNPLLFDTDGDGISDGTEIELGGNPLVVDDDKIVKYQYNNNSQEGLKIEADLKLPLSSANDFNIKQNKDTVIESMPGYLAGPFDMTMSDTNIEGSKIAIKIDTNFMSEEQIKFYKESIENKDEIVINILNSTGEIIGEAPVQTEIIEEFVSQNGKEKMIVPIITYIIFYIEITIDLKDMIDFVYDAYSSYLRLKLVIANKSTTIDSFIEAGKNIRDSLSQNDDEANIVMIFDSTRNMFLENNNQYRPIRLPLAKSIVHQFMSSYSLYNSKMSLLSMADSALWFKPFITDAEQLLASLDSINTLDESSMIPISSNLLEGVSVGLNAFNNLSDTSNHIILITQGATDIDSLTNAKYLSALSLAVLKNVKIHVIQINPTKNNYFINSLPEKTGGEYIIVQDKEQVHLDNIAKDLHEKIFKDPPSDILKDTDSDGLLDFFEKQINSGHILSELGIPIINYATNKIKELDLHSKDTDNDGLTDSEEIEVIGSYEDEGKGIAKYIINNLEPSQYEEAIRCLGIMIGIDDDNLEKILSKFRNKRALPAAAAAGAVSEVIALGGTSTFFTSTGVPLTVLSGGAGAVTAGATAASGIIIPIIVTVVATAVIVGATYLVYKLISNAFSPDTDADGIPDSLESESDRNNDLQILTIGKGKSGILGRNSQNKESVMNRNGKEYAVDFNFNLNRLFFGNEYLNNYNADIAKMSSIISALAYEDNEGTYYAKAYTLKEKGGEKTFELEDLYLKKFIERYGFKDQKSIPFTVNDHKINIEMGYCDYIENPEDNKKPIKLDKPVILISIKELIKSYEDILKSLDYGSEQDVTSSIFWENKDNHKLMDSFANQIYDYLVQYNNSINKYSNKENIVWITGYGFAGGIGNILAQKIQESNNSEKFELAVYTFATPNTTTAQNNKDYKGIFNIVNRDDIGSMIISRHLRENQQAVSDNFGRYGEDIVFPGVGKTDGVLKKHWNKYLNTSYITEKEPSKIAGSIKDISISRSDNYILNDDYKNILSDPIELNEFNSKIDNVLKGYVSISKDNSIKEIEQSPMYAQGILSKILYNEIADGEITFKEIHEITDYVGLIPTNKLIPIILELSNNEGNKLKIKPSYFYPGQPDNFIFYTINSQDIISDRGESYYDVSIKDTTTPKKYHTVDLAADMEVMLADNKGFKKISELDNGDTILTTSISDNDIIVNKVDDKSKTINSIQIDNDTFSQSTLNLNMYTIKFNGSNEEIKVAEDQTLYLDQVGYIPVYLLKKNDKIKAKDGNLISIDSITSTYGKENVYKIKIDNNYGLYMSDKKILLNQSPGLSEEYNNILKEQLSFEDLLTVNVMHMKAVNIMKDYRGDTPAVAVTFDKITNLYNAGINSPKVEDKNSRDGYPKEFAGAMSDEMLLKEVKEKSEFLHDNFKSENSSPNVENPLKDKYDNSFGPGTHAEIHAVAEVLNKKLITNDNINNLMIYVIDGKYNPLVTCPHCSFILGALDKYYETLEDFKFSNIMLTKNNTNGTEEKVPFSRELYKDMYKYNDFNVISNKLDDSSLYHKKAFVDYIKLQVDTGFYYKK